MNKSLNKIRLFQHFHLILLISLFVIGVLGLTLTSINHNVRVYFSPNDSNYLADKYLQKFFPGDDVFIFLFSRPDLFSDSSLKKIESAAKKIERIDNVDRVFSIFTVDKISGSEDGFTVSRLFSDKDWKKSPEEREKTLIQDRFAPNFVIGEDGKSLAIIVRTDKNITTSKHIKIRDSIFNIFENEGLTQSIKAVSGPSEVIFMQYKAMIDSLKILMPISSFIALLLLVWIFPRFIPIILAFSAITISILSAILILNLSGSDFTMIHSMIPPMMTAFTSALIIHYYNRISHYSNAHQTVTSKEKYYQARADIYKPALYTVLTTVAGFGSLAFSPLPAIQSFGIATAFGLIVMFMIVFTLLPAILEKWDKDTSWKTGNLFDNFSSRLSLQAGKYSLRHPIKVLMLTALFIAISIPFLAKIKVETDAFRFFKPLHPITVETEIVENALTGITVLSVLFETEEFNAFQKPEHLEYIKSFQSWVETLPEVDESISLTEIIEEMNWGFHAENPEYRAIPSTRETIAQYLLFYDGEDLYELVNRDFNKARVQINLNVHETGKIRSVVEKIENHLKSNPFVEGKTSIAGFGSLFATLADLIVKTQIYSLLVSVIIIFILLIFIFRTIKGSALCMIPNILPALVIFTLMGVFDIWLDMGTAMIASISVGIAVDDTIHVYHNYIFRRRKGYKCGFSVMRALQHTGRSIVATSVILVVQFIIIAFSDFGPTSHFGLLCSVGIFSALIFDLFLLPALIIIFEKRKHSLNDG